jgi:selenocysteine lyase/cysteine desulfurase
VLEGVPGVTITSPEQHVGLTAFSLAGCDAEATASALLERRVIVRTLHHTPWLRAATGFFNSEDDLVRLRDGLVAVSR